MIPKIIHYCWFGNNPKPKIIRQCISSWQKFCPDYQIIEWNEDNYDINSGPEYIRQAYAAGKWAFVTDYARLDIVNRMGGVYLDTDVELIAPIDHLLQYPAFYGFQGDRRIATGLGFGSEKNRPLLQELMAYYESHPFVLEDGSFDITPCPECNRPTFECYGLIRNGQEQLLTDGSLILPAHVFSPLDFFTSEMHLKPDTVSIHWFAASWLSTTGPLKKKIKSGLGCKGYRLYHRYKRIKLKIYYRHHK